MMATISDDAASLQSDESGFRNFDDLASDAVISVTYNPSGKRCAVVAADHRLRIYDCEDQNLGVQPQLIDQWKAHDAEILDVQWVPFPYIRYIATIASDHKMKIWREDSTQTRLSGRRFRCVMSQIAASHVPYTSFSFHSTSNQDLYLALFTHDGLFTLLEPSEMDSLSGWRLIDQFLPFGKFKPGTEPQFCVSFRPGPTLPPQPLLTLALCASHLFKLYFAMPLPSSPYSTNLRESNFQLQEAVAVHLNHNVHTGTVPTPFINNLAWQPGRVNSRDTLAFACNDGTVRIVEITLPATSISEKDDKGTSKGQKRPHLPRSTSSSSSSDNEDSNPPSLDLGKKEPHRRNSATSTTPSRVSALGSSLTNPIPLPSRPQAPAHLRPSVRETQSLTHDHQGRTCWRVSWAHDGSALVSSGDSAEVVLWKREIGEKAHWENYAHGGKGDVGLGGFVEWSRTRREEDE